MSRIAWGKCLLLALTIVALIAVGASAKSEVIEFWHPTNNPEALRLIDEAVKEWNASNPDLQVKHSVIRPADEMRIKFLSTMAAGNAPDIIYLTGLTAPELADMGAIVPLQELFDQDFLDQYIPAALNQLTYKGDLYGIPLEGSTWGFFYRKDLFLEAGLDPDSPPKTWEELVEYGKALTKDTDGDGRIDQWGLAFSGAAWEPWEYWFPFIWQAGGHLTRYDEASSRWQFALDEPSGREGLQFYADLVHTHKIVSPLITGMAWSEVKDAFVQGKAAMMFNGMWSIHSVNDALPFENGQWATAGNPKGPGGEASLGQALCLGVSRQSSNPEAVARFIEVLLEKERHNAYAQAIGTMSWRKDYLDTDYANQPYVRPLLENMRVVGSLPGSKLWLNFRDKSLNPVLQEIILGSIKVGDALEVLRTDWERLH